MIDPVRTYYSTKPKSLIDLGNNSWCYNYDIQGKTFDNPFKDVEGLPNKIEEYSCVLLIFSNKPTVKECIEGIIRKYITQNQEFDLINSIKMIEFDMLGTVLAELELLKYKAYLNLLQEIKTKVKLDFEN